MHQDSAETKHSSSTPERPHPCDVTAVRLLPRHHPETRAFCFASAADRNMPLSDDLMSFPRRTWDLVLSKVSGAAVFVDARCAEALHWVGGAALLLEAGAADLRPFSSFESCGRQRPRAVFVVSSPLRGRTADVIRDVVSLSYFRDCVVVTAVPHSLHLAADHVTSDPDATPAFDRFEEKLREWMGDHTCGAEVLHAPVAFAPAGPQLLLAPLYSHLFPLLPRDLDAINDTRPDRRRFGSLADVDAGSLPAELRLDVRALAEALGSMLEETGTREESFSVGPMSRLLAGELSAHPRARSRRKTAANKASIIFVDRTLDLTG